MRWRHSLGVVSLGLAGLAASALAGPPDGSGRSSAVYELRVYHCNPGKLDALLARFRDHTLGLFQKHGISNVGYWTPADDDKGKADTLVYLLRHDSREEAKASWDAFRADPEWQAVKAESEKDGVALAAKVESTYLVPTDYSPGQSDPAKSRPARIFELRTYTASPGKLDDLHRRFREHTLGLFTKHGMTNIGYWTPADDDKGKATTLVYLIAHDSREAAKKSWDAFGNDPQWQEVYKASQPDGVPLAAKVESVYLIPTDFSPLH
jgi:hypothetical protein